MTIPVIPRAFYAKGNLDLEAVNDNLRAYQRIIARGQAQRYSTTSFRVDLSGMADTDGAAGGRQVLIPTLLRDTTLVSVQVIGVEVVMYAPTGATWTLASSASSTWGGLSVTTAGDTTEAYAQTNESLPVVNNGTFSFTWTSSTSSTITRGYMIFHMLCDRGQQDGWSFVGYSPTLLSAASSTAGGTLDTELNNIATAVNIDTQAQTDLRLMAFQVRNLVSSGSQSVIIPAGIRTGASIGIHPGHSQQDALYLAAVAPVGATITASISSAVLGTKSTNVGGGGVTATAVADGNALGAADGGDPTVSANDITLTISRGADGGAVAPFCYMFVWFK